MRRVTAEQMKNIDRLARERYNIPSIVLMENAGRAGAEEILKERKKGEKALVLCGKGNNGGDGFVCARYLENSGIKTNILILGRTKDIKGRDPVLNLAMLKRSGARIREVSTKRDRERLKKSVQYDFAVDAIFGIGFKGSLPEGIADIVGFLNRSRKPVYALDVPSGLNATSGEVHGACVKARKTITFGLPKKGFFSRGAGAFTGKIVVRDIGFPRQLIKK